jgi:hypothetical protein
MVVSVLKRKQAQVFVWMSAEAQKVAAEATLVRRVIVTPAATRIPNATKERYVAKITYVFFLSKNLESILT